MKTATRIALLLVILMAALLVFPGRASASDGYVPSFNDKVVVGGTFELGAGESIDGNLAVLGGAVSLQEGSVVNGDVASAGGSLSIGGEVNGSITIMGGVVALARSAVVHGDIINVGGNLTNDGATIVGSIRSSSEGPLVINPTTNIPNFFTRSFKAATDFLGSLAQVVLLAGLAMLVVLVFPRPTQRLSTTLATQPALSGGLGLLTFMVAPALLVLLIITIILSPVGLLGILALGLALLFGWVGLGLLLGQRLAQQFHQNWSEVAAAGIGTLVASAAAWLIGWIPCLGWLVVFLAWMAGLGGVVLTRFGTQTFVPAGSAAPGVPASRAVVDAPVVSTPAVTSATVGNFPAAEPGDDAQDEPLDNADRRPPLA